MRGRGREQLSGPVGEGSGKVVAAAAGAAVGAIVGDRLSDRGRQADTYAEREVRRCQVVDNWESRISGYRVVYEYAGHVYTTILPYDPGRKLAVNVSVTPAEAVADGYGRHPRDSDWDD